LQSLKNSKSYVGFTSEIPEMRLYEHNIGSNKWTGENGPFKLKYYESFCCKKEAIHRERFLKSGVGRKLVKLIIENFN